ncbi:hypothetical protein CCUS01_10838 [Colletotrichum cuscutae]|uniref:Uncharacterized protein n=4 Tax=Colletotrichum acutatum species complex TaxID=2707335 RepID=A0AAI9YPQ5_9PEZI|nr:uncharacterized protein CCOS01_11736 [Colletotrichum costaricense]XP_060382948.1 uncharacterized protein CTAM01_06191 [Colletotrichum tamarilloi]KAI3531412.1 hypothetical protein CSPX01_14164 [Colletotrichum filicis]KAK0375065.1 hypothetical protein CLIM01_07589 [Colletotrichum limetticola]KAK1452607.1 hypothetical protein CCUS01_10838 [Colletotrichum cuscutae]KAK1500739.1 hypothetical protein CTAM01_06191 [Colletotrichum tamarilloi]KAK1518916.1 hypothetical protein CCOS01_11736 [Colletotr
MIEDLHSAIVRVRIASLQSEVLSRTSSREVVRRRSSSKVKPVHVAKGRLPLFTKQRSVRVVS